MITSLTRSLVSSKQWYRSMLAGNEAYIPNSYDLISTTILGSDTSSVTFDVSTLASTYKHLQIRLTGRSIGSNYESDVKVTFNSDSGSNYSYHKIDADGGSISSWGAASQSFMSAGYLSASSNTANAFGAVVIDFLDPFSTTKYKTIRGLGGFRAASYPRIMLSSGSWRSTSAVTAITVTDGLSSFITGSRFSIYGIKG